MSIFGSVLRGTCFDAGVLNKQATTACSETQENFSVAPKKGAFQHQRLVV